MSTNRKPRVPSYRLHRQSGQAVVTLTDTITGQHKDHLLDTPSLPQYHRRVMSFDAVAARAGCGA